MTSTRGDQERQEPAATAPQPPWRSVPKRGRSAPRPQLSRDVVVTAALKVVETEGGDALTMRRVADEIGVSASSLYGYVANKEELVQLVLEQIMTEIPVPEPATDWQDMLRAWARDCLAVFRRHPGVAGLTLGRVPFGPSMLVAVERMLATLRAAGLPDQVAAFAGDLGSLYVAAFAHEQDVTPVAEPGDFAAQAATWLKSLPRDQFPNTVAVADVMVAGTGNDRFEWGLDVLIRGFASYLSSPPTAEAHWPAS
ncbi:MAG TPA: TetR/AcrR family transcriptional regulator [Streptosporangiaceae bacterium]|nr:TetR/AcrR family transcriptional regulator [Streptosporangiaceae bacterium]